MALGTKADWDQFLDGAVVRGVHSAICVDEQLVSETGVEESSGAGADQRVLAVGECGRLVSDVLW